VQSEVLNCSPEGDSTLLADQPSEAKVARLSPKLKTKTVSLPSKLKKQHNRVSK